MEKRHKTRKNLIIDSKYEQKFFLYKITKFLIFPLRSRIFYVFIKNIPARKENSVLDLGVTDNNENYFYKLYPYPQKITAAGLAKQNNILKEYSAEIVYRQVTEDFPYPFKDDEFDVVHSSAVIEHVGCRERQKTFVKECYRIGRRGMISTPSRFFPMDLHTMLPFVYWLPLSVHRIIYKFLGFTVWAKEENLNFISFNDLQKMALELKITNFRIVKHYTFGFLSNYLFFWDKDKRN